MLVRMVVCVFLAFAFVITGALFADAQKLKNVSPTKYETRAPAKNFDFHSAMPLAEWRRRTAAYNAHDIDAFIATYSQDIRIYEYPDTFLGKGTQRLRDIFGPQFAENDGSIIVHNQDVLEETVVSNETVTFYGTTEHNIGIYTVVDGLITEVRLIEPKE